MSLPVPTAHVVPAAPTELHTQRHNRHNECCQHVSTGSLYLVLLVGKYKRHLQTGKHLAPANTWQLQIGIHLAPANKKKKRV